MVICRGQREALLPFLSLLSHGQVVCSPNHTASIFTQAFAVTQLLWCTDHTYFRVFLLLHISIRYYSQAFNPFFVCLVNPLADIYYYCLPLDCDEIHTNPSSMADVVFNNSAAAVLALHWTCHFQPSNQCALVYMFYSPHISFRCEVNNNLAEST